MVSGLYPPSAGRVLFRGALGTPAVHREEAAARERGRALLRRLGLEPFVQVEAARLSLGAQKRLEIARALAGEPRLLLLGEPAGGLNPTETRTLMELIRRVRDESGLTILLVEHDMDLVMGIGESGGRPRPRAQDRRGDAPRDCRRSRRDRGLPGGGSRGPCLSWKP